MGDYELSVTLKAGTGFDSPWIVVYGNTPDEVEHKLNNISGVVTATIEAANLLKAANNAAPLATGGQDHAPQQQQAPASNGWGNRPAQQQSAPAQQGARLHPEGKACRCGQVLQFKDVYSQKKQKSFQFWECPLRRGQNDPHDSEFAN